VIDVNQFATEFVAKWILIVTTKVVHSLPLVLAEVQLAALPLPLFQDYKEHQEEEGDFDE